MPQMQAKKVKKPTKKRTKSRPARPAVSRVAAPVGFGTIEKFTQPRFSGGKGSAVRIRHREMFHVVGPYSTSAFTANAWRINPCNQVLFPWLSLIAGNWEYYKFNQLKFAYVQRCSTSSTGSITMFVDYDVLDPLPATEVIACSNSSAISGPVWTPITCVAARDGLSGGMTMKYTATSVPANADPKMYDEGRFVFTIADQLTNSVFGRVWVEYDVELSKPQLPLSALGSAMRLVQSAGNPAQPFNNYSAIYKAGPYEITPTSYTSVRIDGLAPNSAYIVEVNISPDTIANVTGLQFPTFIGATTLASTTYDSQMDSGNAIGWVTMWKGAITALASSVQMNYVMGGTGTFGGIQVVVFPIYYNNTLEAAWKYN